MVDWKNKHAEVMEDFLEYLNLKTNAFILKGGNALRICYNMPRFSEDIDFDAQKENIIKYVMDFCNERGYDFRIGKDTPTTKRCFIHYDKNHKPLKIEASYRERIIDVSTCAYINSINVYDINRLTKKKAMAYMGRDKIRDMYDLAFICSKYWDYLSEDTKENIRDALSCKGLEQFDYMVDTQKDDSIDEEKLLSDFLSMFEKAGILANVDEFQSEEISNSVNNSSQNAVNINKSAGKSSHKKSSKSLKKPKHESYGRY